MPELTSSPASVPPVRVKNVSLKAGGVSVLENVSLDIPAGKIVTLIGPNGAGKSTLLKVILGILTPDEGYVEKRKGLKIGYVPQKLHIPLSVPITVKRFLSLNNSHSEAKKSAVFEETGIPHLADRQVHTLSGGETQRLLLARALLEDPDLLVLDEPAQGLDPVGEEKLCALIERLNKERGCAILTVSHNLHVVMAQTHRVVCLNRHVCCTGHPDDVISLPAYASLFGANRSHLALYTHRHDHIHNDNGEITRVE